MAYRLPDITADLEFEEHPGLEVAVRISPLPFGAYFDAVHIVHERDDLDAREWLDAIVEVLAPHLVGWNLPEPADAAGLRAQPYQIVLAIARAWVRAVPEVPVPLGRRSNDGATSEDPSPESTSEPESSTDSPAATA
jgi:hypothetical protein